MQGSFAEHLNMLRSMQVEAVPVKQPNDLQGLDALILPGGESTAIALLCEKAGLWEPLKEWVRMDRPTWV